METGHTILIVDDTPSNLGILLAHFHEAGYRVLVAESGKSAIEQIAFVTPDIILLDVLMPGMNGYDTCRILRQDPRTKGVPILFITALTSSVDKVKGFEVGGVDYITKPFEPDEVLARVRTHLTIKSLQHQLKTENERLEQRVQERTSALQDANAALRAEIALRRQSQADKDRLFELAQQQGTQINTLMRSLSTQDSQVDGAANQLVLAPLKRRIHQLRQLIDRDETLRKHKALSDTFKQIDSYLHQMGVDASEKERALALTLTDREQEVLGLLVNGCSSTEIAHRLNLSDPTVRTYRARIMKKLDIYHMPGLVKFALRIGLTSVHE